MSSAALPTQLTHLLMKTAWLGGRTGLYLNLFEDGTGTLVHLAAFSSLYAQNLEWRIIASSSTEDSAERRAALDGFVVKPGAMRNETSLVDVVLGIAFTTRYESGDPPRPLGPPVIPVPEREFKITLRSGRWGLNGGEAQAEEDVYTLCMDMDASPVPPEECLTRVREYPHILEKWRGCTRFYGWPASH